MKYLLLVLIFSTNLGYSSEFDEFSDNSLEEKESKFLELSGFFEFEQGLNITSSGVQRSDTNETNYVMANRRFRIDAAKIHDNGGFYTKVDLLIDGITGQEKIKARELRFQYKVSESLDLSVGRQVSTWGVSDMLFINDLFPKNWVANFTGQDMELLKEPADSIRLTSYLGQYTIDTVYTPKFSPDVTPTGCRFAVFDPNTQQLISNKDSCSNEEKNTSNNTDDGEIAINLKKNFDGIDYALYGYYGFYKSPKGIELQNSQYVGSYPRLSVYGASVEGQVGPGIISIEAGHYTSIDDPSGSDPLIENSMLKYLMGYRMDLTSKFSFGFQIYQEKMQNYKQYEEAYQTFNPSNYEYRKKEISSTYTLRLSYKLMQETLNLSMFTYYRPDDHDSFTKLEISKKVTTDLNTVLGASIFTGDKNYLDREFAMLKDDDNLYIRLKYSF